MIHPSDICLVLATTNENFAQTLKVSLAGVDLRNVKIVSEPKELVEVVKEHDPDVMISILDGTEKDTGLSMIRFIRRWEKSPNRYIPIVAASSKRDAQTVRAVLNAGGHEYAVLPISGAALLKKVMNSIFVGFSFIEEKDGYVGPCRRRRVDPNYNGPERRSNWTAPAENREEKEAMVASMMQKG